MLTPTNTESVEEQNIKQLYEALANLEENLWDKSNEQLVIVEISGHHGFVVNVDPGDFVQDTDMMVIFRRAMQKFWN